MLHAPADQAESNSPGPKTVQGPLSYTHTRFLEVLGPWDWGVSPPIPGSPFVEISKNCRFSPTSPTLNFKMPWPAAWQAGKASELESFQVLHGGGGEASLSCTPLSPLEKP